MEYDIMLQKPPECTVDREGRVTGKAVFVCSYSDILNNRCPTLKVGLPFGDIMPGLTDADGLTITDISFRDTELRCGGVRLAAVTVTACSREPKITADSYSFEVNIRSAVMQERYRGCSVWQSLGTALPAEDKIMNIPYTVLTLSGTYTLALGAEAITSAVNTVNMYPWNLTDLYGVPGLGTVSPGNAKFVGFSCSINGDSTTESPRCRAVFTFHLRGFDWNLKVRPAEAMKDIDGKVLYWQDRYSFLPTYTGNAAPGITAVPGTPVWAGTNTVIGGPAALGQNVFDTELIPPRDGTSEWIKEFPPAVWEFVGCTAPAPLPS